MVKKYRAAHVEAEAAGGFLMAKPTRNKYIIHLEQRTVPQWGHAAKAIELEDIEVRVSVLE